MRRCAPARAGPLEATMTVRRRSCRAAGSNVVATWRGRRRPDGDGADDDGWSARVRQRDRRRGAARHRRALAAPGDCPPHRLCLTSRTARSSGSWTAPSTGASALAAGERDPSRVGRAGAVPPLPGGERAPDLRLALEAPVELTALGARGRPDRRGRGLADLGLADAPARHGTEQWPLLVAGVPGVTAFNWETAFAGASTTRRSTRRRS